MFARVKKSGKYQYLQIVENRKEKGKVKQRVIATVGRMDQLQSKGRVETLIRSLPRFSEQALMIISGQSDISADARKIGPVLIFERLWKETGIKAAIERVLAGRKFEFNVERAIFLTVLHRLMVSGSDRFCIRWCSDYLIDGIDELDLHHLYRAMGFWGKSLRIKLAPRPFHPAVIKTWLKRSSFPIGGIYFRVWIWSFLIPPRSILKAEVVRASANEVLARTTGLILSRWWSAPSSMTRTSPSAARCGPAIQPMSQRFCPLLND